MKIQMKNMQKIRMAVNFDRKWDGGAKFETTLNF